MSLGLEPLLGNNNNNNKVPKLINAISHCHTLFLVLFSSLPQGKSEGRN